MKPNETREQFEARVTARATELGLVPGTLAWDATRFDMALSDAGQAIKEAARRDWDRLVAALARHLPK
jgi:hypothetical protein